MAELEIYMPEKAQLVLSQKKRYSVLYGGRGSGKSFAIAHYLIIEALNAKHRVLCAREFQSTIRDSVHRLLCDRIYALGLDQCFDMQKDYIICKTTGSQFLFKGIRNNIAEIKSLQGVTRCWVEEAEKASKDSLGILIPTIREECSQLFFSFNPESRDSPCYQMFVLEPHPDCAALELNFYDNACFPDVLRKEMEWCKKVDPDAYEHIWLGKLKGYSDALIFKNKYFVEDFEYPHPETQFYYGADFGFSVDAMWMGRMFIQGKSLYICDEVYGVGIEIDELPAYWDKVPGSRKWTIRADSARPDTISYLNNHGFSVVGAEKGPGSVEDGISFLRAFERIVIHSRCPGAASNYANYRWKQDRITQEILPVPVDKNNHAPDGTRYALESIIKQNEGGVFTLDYDVKPE